MINNLNVIEDIANSINNSSDKNSYLVPISSNKLIIDTKPDQNQVIDSIFEIYIRCSTLKQFTGKGFNSPDRQKQNCFKYLKNIGAITSNVYRGDYNSDFGTGTTIGSKDNIRLSLLESLQHLATETEYKNKYLVVNDYSRLTRSFEDGKKILKFCEEHDITICSAKDKSNTSTQQGIDLYLSKVKYEEEWLLHQKEKQKVGLYWGMEHRRPRFGLKVVDNHLVKDNAEIKVIKQISALHNAKNKTIEQIVDYLNTKSIPSDSGSLWSYESVRSIIDSSKKRNNIIKFKKLFRSYNKSFLEKQSEKVFEFISGMVNLLTKKYKLNYKIKSKSASLDCDQSLAIEVLTLYNSFVGSNKPIRKSKKKGIFDIKKAKDDNQKHQIYCAEEFIKNLCGYHDIDIQEVTPALKKTKEHNEPTR